MGELFSYFHYKLLPLVMQVPEHVALHIWDNKQLVPDQGPVRAISQAIYVQR